MARRPRNPTVGALLAALLLGALLVACAKKTDHSPIERTTTTTAHRARPVGYVALGDSITAGGGAPPYADATCAVSTKSWPYLLDALDPDLELVDMRACGGAGSVQLVEPWTEKGLPSQVPTEPDPSVGLVTITIGGNDTNLLLAIVSCATTDCGNLTRSKASKDTVQELMAELTDKVYPAVRAAYPQARIVQVGYPYLTSTKLGQTCPWLGPGEDTGPNKLVGAVDDALRSAAIDAGYVDFADIRTALAGHELCTKVPWVNDGNAGANALHPTAAGYQAIAKAVKAYLDR